MKKFIALAMVLSLCAVGVMAQPTVTGDLSAIYKFEDAASSSNMGRVRIGVAIPVGEFTTVNLDLRDDTFANGFLAFNQVYAVTDVSGALGLDGVAIKLTGGLFEYWISNFQVATTQHRTRAVETFKIGQEVAALALDIGIGDFGTIKTYVGFPNPDEIAYKFGFMLGPVVEGLSAALSYSGGKDTADTDGIEDYSYFKVEAAYSFAVGDGMTLAIPGSFLANLEEEYNQWDLGVKFTGMGLTAAVEFGNTNMENEEFINALDLQVKYDVAEMLQIYANIFTDPITGDFDLVEEFLEAIDLGVKVTLGTHKVFVGYVIDTDQNNLIGVTEDDSTGRAGILGGGFYIAWRVTF